MGIREGGLDELAARVRTDLESVDYPARPWVRPRRHDGEPMHDVVIVGGGQNAIAIAFGLRREQVRDVVILDRNPPDRAGPWVTFARMQTLRTPKTVCGPELGIPSLSVRAWYEARFGAGAWASLGKIPRAVWHDYVLWLRDTLGITVTADTEVDDIEPLDGGGFAVHAATAGGGRIRVLARTVVLATGIEGSGRWLVPAAVEAALPRALYAHTADPIDFSALAGRRVAVIGAGASAFDNAAMALEAGAAAVEVFARRRALPKANPNRFIEDAGFLRHFHTLDDATRWRFMATFLRLNQPPPQDTFERCARHDAFDLHLSSPIEAVAHEDGRVVLTTPRARRAYDFLIVGTGFSADLAARPELRRIEGAIARWGDRYAPPAGEENAMLAAFPYLGPEFQFTERRPGEAPHLGAIFANTFGAIASHSATAGISQLKYATERIVSGVTRRLFLEQADSYLPGLLAYDEVELDTSAFEAARAARAAAVA